MRFIFPSFTFVLVSVAFCGNMDAQTVGIRPIVAGARVRRIRDTAIVNVLNNFELLGEASPVKRTDLAPRRSASLDSARVSSSGREAPEGGGIKKTDAGPFDLDREPPDVRTRSIELVSDSIDRFVVCGDTEVYRAMRHRVPSQDQDPPLEAESAWIEANSVLKAVKVVPRPGVLVLMR